MTATTTLTELLTDTLYAQETARLAELHAGELRGKATNLETQLKAAMLEAGTKKISSDEHHLDVSVVTRKDVRIIDMDEFAAALSESGMSVPMTTPEPKPDVTACKNVAKAFPDMPGVEPFETVYLKWTGHTS